MALEMKVFLTYNMLALFFSAALKGVAVPKSI
jgi:hypothetical protein